MSMTPKRFQYQGLAKPISPTVEEVTVDKYWQPTSEPIRIAPIKKALYSLLATSIFFTELITPVDAGKLPDWYQQTNEPVRVVKNIKYVTDGDFKYDEEIIQPNISKWGQPQSEFVRVKPNYNWITQGDLKYDEEIIQPNINKWGQLISEPVRVKPNYNWITHGDFKYDEEIIQPNINKWFLETSQPLFDVKRTQFSYPSLTFIEVVIEAPIIPPLDSWHPATNQFPGSRKRGEFLYYNFTYVKSTRLINENFENIGSPGYDEPGWVETVTAGNTLDENSAIPGTPPIGSGSQCLKAIVISGAVSSYADRILGDSNIAHIQTFVYISEEGLNDGQVVDFSRIRDSAGNTVIDAIFVQVSGILKLRLRYWSGGVLQNSPDVDASLNTWYRIEYKYDITNMLWEWRINKISQASGSLVVGIRIPNRLWAGAVHNGLAQSTVYVDLVVWDNNNWPSLEDAITENITLDKWLPTPNQPLFDIKRLQYSYPTLVYDTEAFTQSELILLDKWLQPQSEPVRVKPNYNWITQGDFKYDEEIIQPNINKWLQASNQPLFDVKRIQSTYPSLTFIELVTEAPIVPTLDGWWIQTSEPIRTKLNCNWITHGVLELSDEQRYVYLDKYWQQANEPVRIIPNYNWITYVDFKYDISIITTPLDRWVQPICQPLFDVKRQQWLYPILWWDVITPIPLPSQLDMWWKQTNEPVRIAPNYQKKFEWFFMPPLNIVSFKLKPFDVLSFVFGDLAESIDISGNSIKLKPSTAIPSGTAKEGTIVPYDSGSERALYIYLSGSWRKITIT